MPYTESNVPTYVPKDKAKAWAATWNAAYSQAIKEGKSHEAAESYAFAVASGKHGPNSKKAEDSMHELMKEGADPGALHIFCPLVKVDEAKREVWGVVTAEVPDKDNEVCDFDTTVPYYRALVDEMSKATDGVNIFPLREMHGLSAAGKGISIQFREGSKEVYMGFKVVDDAAWKKVQECVYTGFSQGGRYVKRWKDGEYTKYTAKPSEVSLVDVPCLTRAHFDYVKADGVVEKRAFKKEAEIPTGNAGAIPTLPTPVNNVPASDLELVSRTSLATVPSEEEKQRLAAAAGKCSCKCASCEKGSCSGCTADEKCSAHKAAFDKAVKYLVTESDGTTHLPYTDADGKPNHRLMGAAWAALHGGYRGNKYEGPNKQAAIKRLKQVYAREGMDTPSEKMERADGLIKTILTDTINRHAFGMLGKGMYTVSRFAEIVEELKYLWISLEYEREQEDDESPATDDLKSIFESILDAFLSYTEEQIEELSAHAAAFEGGLTMATQAADLEKAARKSLAHHFHKSASHHEQVAAIHEKCMKAHEGAQAHHEELMGKAADPNDHHHKVKAAFHKSMAGHHEHLHKKHSAHAEHLHKMAESCNEEDASKVLKLAGLEEGEILDTLKTTTEITPTVPPAPTASSEELGKLTAAQNETNTLLKALIEKLSAASTTPPPVNAGVDAAKKAAEILAAAGPIVRTFPVPRTGDMTKAAGIDANEVDPQFADLLKIEHVE